MNTTNPTNTAPVQGGSQATATEVPEQNLTPQQRENAKFKEYQKSLIEKSKTESQEDARLRPREAKEDSETEQAEQEREQAKQAAKRKLKYKGEVREYDESEYEKLASLGIHANEKMQEAAAMRKQTEKFIEALRTNPRAILSHPSLGINLQEIATELLWEQAQQAQMSPEEIEYRRNLEELERYRETEKAEKQRQAQARQEAMEEHFRQDYARQITSVLDTAGLPKSDWTVTQMSKYMRQALRQGFKDVTPSDIVHLVKQDYMAIQRDLYSNSDGNQLIDIMGEDVVDKIRKAELARHNKASRQEPASSQVRQQSQPRDTYSSLEELKTAMKKKLQ